MASRKHLVVVDDEPVARESLAAYLEREGFRVTMSKDIRDLRGVLDREPVDLILLDIRLPGEDGLSFLRKLRSRSDLPVIFVTGRGDEVDRVIGLELGADDYVTKPFAHRELLARIRTLLRRTSQGFRSERPDCARHFAGWTLDLSKRCLTATDGEEVRLTRGEFDLLAALVRSPGQVLSRDTLLDESGHRDGAPNDRTVDVLIARLRRKIEVDSADPRLIVTEHGVGYRFAGPVS
ncbi:MULTISPECIES: response regulator [Rhodopseudomonas]|uniref:Regulatory protein VirG n=1 Tax=Rhodopseudomonas palustris TaxID=1076 RepID=A0A0D7E0Q8_RHOPL|nr:MULTISPECIES: response regulator [Rhodopseudomonas]KIZ34419.1 transcriptional regulatory protein AruR [Rhodopseudomonas palustris]MDF3810315.1 response regulator [Rhodopseudomonas sp. BAL398]WOK19893.1 response regulator [Rhodopseudomonas sp. BAL398]